LYSRSITRRALLAQSVRADINMKPPQNLRILWWISVYKLQLHTLSFALVLYEFQRRIKRMRSNRIVYFCTEAKVLL